MTQPSRKQLIGFWLATTLFCLPMVGGAALELQGGPEQLEMMAALGYPAYLLTILGVGKLLGVVLVLVPGLVRIKEWAYAGFMIDLVGAAASHSFNGDPVVKIATPAGFAVLVMASWWLRPPTRVLAPPLPGR